MLGFPHVLLESPDHRLHLILEPQPDAHSAWWRIHPAENRTWSAQFGGHTPVEMIAGFTDALDSPAPQRDMRLWDLAAHRGWTLLRTGKERAAVSPDETALLSLVPSISETPQWRWTLQVSAPLLEGSAGGSGTPPSTKPLQPPRSTDSSPRSPSPARYCATRARPRPSPSDTSTPTEAPSPPNSTVADICSASKPLGVRPHRTHRRQCRPRPRPGAYLATGSTADQVP
ncbi:DUF317 domain-containing protein [Streptomyces anulatus]|uniref:DUF317 domain-containing protein n=1 Tax=Streptomyces anulatus TaxID=1892 RepID=UPI003655A23C